MKDREELQQPLIVGRGAAGNPKNRFRKIEIEPDLDELDPERPKTVYLEDTSRSIVARKDSPDVSFEASINPYRGCEHGCAYYYARPTHEYLRFSVGLHFESKILVKKDAPRPLRGQLSSRRWKPQILVFSGVTAPYQLVGDRLRLTRLCLEVLAEFRSPVAVVTKNHLVTRDVDLLSELARHNAASVAISLTTLDDDLRRVMEPRTSRPFRRLAAIEALFRAGIPVGVMAAPMIPGLNDYELPALISGGRSGRELRRLHRRVAALRRPLFEDWLTRHYPERKKKVLNQIQSVRGGKLNDSRFGSRMRGEGIFAEHIAQLFSLSCRRAGIEDGRFPSLSTAAFGVPGEVQLSLFD